MSVQKVINLVRNDKKIVFLTPLRQQLPPLLGECIPAGLLEGRDGIQKFRLELRQFFFQRFDDQSVLISLDGYNMQIVVSEDT